MKTTSVDVAVRTGLAALVGQPELTSREDGPERQRELDVYPVRLTDLTVDAQVDDVVVFTASRDPLLQGAHLVVRGVGLDATGLFRVLRCEKRRDDGG